MIVIVDDPLSSFDDDRRLETACRLARLGQECKQLIVLTHRMDLVGLLHRQPDFSGRFLKLAIDKTQGARMELLDVKHEQLLDHEKHIQALQAFADHGTIPAGDNVQRLVRSVLECGLRTKHGIKALPYHAGLDDGTRVKNQDAFNKDEVDVIVATVAFGMGIDKSNVRYVLHGDLPKNMESYYQETGRSGRDGEPARCLLLFGYGDIPKIRFFFDEITDETEKKHAIKCLNDMVHYATVHACRRKQLLNYFGEEYPPGPEGPALHSLGDGGPCCDICAGEIESIDATRDAQILMSAIARTRERLGINHIVAVVTGDDSDRIRQLGHDQIKTYGVGKDQDKRHWRLMIDNLLAQGLVLQTTGDYPVLKLQPESREVLFGGREVHVLKTKKLPPKSRRRGKAGGAAVGEYNEDLFDQLRDLRKELATEQRVPPYVVFTDRTLHEMARFFPATESEMHQLTGVGEKRLASYGRQFLDAVQAFRQAHPDAQVLASLADQAASLSEPSRISDPASRTGDEVPSYMDQAKQERPRAYEKWTDEEDERLRQAWEEQEGGEDTTTGRIRSLAEDFQRKPGAIRSRLKKLGLLDTPPETV